MVGSEFTQRMAQAGLTGYAPGGAGGVSDFIAFGGARRSGDPLLARLGEQAFVAGLNDLLLLGGLLGLAGALLCAVLIRPADFRSGPAPAVGAHAASASA